MSIHRRVAPFATDNLGKELELDVEIGRAATILEITQIKAILIEKLVVESAAGWRL